LLASFHSKWTVDSIDSIWYICVYVSGGGLGGKRKEEGWVP